MSELGHDTEDMIGEGDGLPCRREVVIGESIGRYPEGGEPIEVSWN